MVYHPSQLVNLMLAKQLFRQLLISITILIPFVFAGAIFAGAADEELNADLIKAAFSGNLPEVERLLGKGADVNAKRDNGITALMGASIEGHREIVVLLLAKGADVGATVNMYGRNGTTACDFASQADHQEIVRLLVNAGAFHEERAETVRAERGGSSPDTNQPGRRSRRD